MTIESKIAARLSVRRLDEWSKLVESNPARVWSQVLVPAVQGQGLVGKASILKALFDANDRETGVRIREMVQAKVDVDALTEAAEMLADGVLTRAELEEIL